MKFCQEWGDSMPELPLAQELPWPLPTETPYRVSDLFGEFVEVIAADAYDGAKVLGGHRLLLVENDEWSENFDRRRILRVGGLSGVRE